MGKAEDRRGDKKLYKTEARWLGGRVSAGSLVSIHMIDGP
jgi:hypothetical protein